MKPGKLNALAAASTEMGVGVLIFVGFLTPVAAAGLIALMTVAIITVHWRNGFMITNPGGGIEYCLGVAVMALGLGTSGAGLYSLDHLWDVFSKTSFNTNVAVTVVVGVTGALIQLAAFYRPTR